ncbi:MAG TPA: DUF11 domain-containing protein [Chloroflexi bacterium]|nr:DUF11 domain-containing protein [Chloroflexota bacterium]
MRTKRPLLFSAICLLGMLLIWSGGLGKHQVHASVLAGLTPTPTPTSTPTPITTPSPPPTQQANLQVSKVAQPTQAIPGGTIVYTIVVENLGPGAATGVMLLDQVPPQLEVLEATVTQGEVLVEGNRVTATVGVLGVGHSATLAITARVRADVPPGTQVENVVVAWSDQTGEITAAAVITVPGLLPESGGSDWGIAWAGVALALFGAGLAGLGLSRRGSAT